MPTVPCRVHLARVECSWKKEEEMEKIPPTQKPERVRGSCHNWWNFGGGSGEEEMMNPIFDTRAKN